MLAVVFVDWWGGRAEGGGAGIKARRGCTCTVERGKGVIGTDKGQ